MKAAASIIKSFFAVKMQNKNIEIILINIIIQLYIFRTTLPVFKYAFIGLFPLVFLYIIYSNRNKIFKSLWITINQLKFVIILIAIFFLAFVFSGIFYEIILVDLINSIILIVLFYILILLLDNRTQLDYFIHIFIHLVFVSALFVIISLWTSLFSLTQDESNTSEIIDTNFALLPLFFGFFGIFYFYIKKHLRGILNLSYTLLLVLFTLQIFFSGSRRGLILISVFIIILIFIYIISLIYKNLYIKQIARASRLYVLSLIILSGILYSFIFCTSCWFKNRSLGYLGVENLAKTKSIITYNLLGYFNLFNKNLSYRELNKILWAHDFDSRDPDCGWSYKDLDRVYNLSGQNVEIVPKGAIGSRIDSTSFNGENPFKKWSKIITIEAEESKVFLVSLYCYVSNDFNGDRVTLLITSHPFKNKIVSRKAKSDYNLNKKGTWQFLEIKLNCLDDGSVPIYLHVLKDIRKDGKLSGNVIIAYPNVYEGKPHISDNFISNNIGNFKVNLKKIATNYQTSFMFISKNAHIFSDPDHLINRITNKLSSKDTAKLGIKIDFNEKHDPNHVIQGRTDRWKFAWHLFKNEYNWKQKLFGNGFDYLTWYGEYFHDNPKREDWPHNPFLSVLLYSGILGLAFYLFVFFKAVYYYIKYIKEYYIFFIFFLITFFFAFFSVNSPFVPPVWGFMLMFPFFLHSVLKKEKVSHLKSDR